VAADLRERVARAIARDENGDETGWQAWLPEADAVLAELKQELQPQAEPPFTVSELMHVALAAVHSFARPENWNDPEDPEQAEAWTLVDAALLAYKKAMEAAPQPQAEPIGDAPVYAAYKWLPDSDWGYCPPDEKFRDGERPEVFVILSAQAAPPSPQASAEDVELVSNAMVLSVSVAWGAWQRIEADMVRLLGVGK
jgi:hypothetical protein